MNGIPGKPDHGLPTFLLLLFGVPALAIFVSASGGALYGVAIVAGILILLAIALLKKH